jgi:hypothetical protein
MPAGPQDKIFVVTHKRKITFEHHGSRTILEIASNESQLESDIDSPSKDGRAWLPLDGSTARPHDMMERFKNWCRNLTYFTNQSLQESLAPDRSYYESVIVFFPENKAYPIYNLDVKLGERDGHTSIEFRCSASTDGESSFREVTLEIGLFHLGNVNSQYHEKCHPMQYFR